MAAQTADRKVVSRAGDHYEPQVAADEKFFNGSLVMRGSDGYAKRPSAVASDVAIGVCDKAVDNTDGSDGDVRVKCRTGVFAFLSGESADALTIEDIGSPVYAIDDRTVGKTSNGNARSVAGVLRAIEGSLYFVEVGKGAAAGGGQGDLVSVTLDADDVSGTNVYNIVSPLAGTIEKAFAVVNGTTDDETTLTLAIEGTPVTGGEVSIAAGAAGTSGSATPSAANTLAAGDVVSATVGGANANAVKATITLLVRRS